MATMDYAVHIGGMGTHPAWRGSVVCYDTKGRLIVKGRCGDQPDIPVDAKSCDQPEIPVHANNMLMDRAFHIGGVVTLQEIKNERYADPARRWTIMRYDTEKSRWIVKS